MTKIKNIRNVIDYNLRKAWRWSPSVHSQDTHLESDNLFRHEIANLFEGLNLKSYIGDIKTSSMLVADVGCRNFNLAPLYKNFFSLLGYESEIFGYEVDPHRRFTNFKTRAAYGEYYSQKTENSYYIKEDFLYSEKDFHVVFLLNPFVSLRSLLSWGLPTRYFKPQEIFNHAAKAIYKNKGLVVASFPTHFEFKKGLQLAHKANLELSHSYLWEPETNSLQKKSRIGAIFTKNAHQ